MLNLKSLREERKISQQKLSKEIGVSRSTIAMWETGGSQPDNDNLIVLAKYFNVSTDYLLGNSDNPSNYKNELGNEEFALWGDIKDLTEDEIKDIAEYIKFKKSQRKNNI